MSKRTGAQGFCDPPSQTCRCHQSKGDLSSIPHHHVCPSKTLEKLIIAVFRVAAASMREPTEWTSTGDWGPQCLGTAVHTPWISSPHVPDLKNE